jgi:hypothetical protein
MPLQGLADCESYGVRKLLTIVAASAGSPQETQKLHNALGDRYFHAFEKAWQNRIQVEKQRQAEIIPREVQERVRQEREYKEFHEGARRSSMRSGGLAEAPVCPTRINNGITGAQAPIKGCSFSPSWQDGIALRGAPVESLPLLKC